MKFAIPDWTPSNLKKGSAKRTVIHRNIINLSDQLNALFVNIIITASTLLEALINLYLSIKCSDAGKQEVFKILERAKFEEKWKIAPKVFLEEYELPAGCSPGQDLRGLIKMRNDLVHYKSQVGIGLDGEGGKPLSFDIDEKYSEKIRRVKSFLELPKKLLRHLYKYDKSSELIGRLSDSIALSDQEKAQILAPH